MQRCFEINGHSFVDLVCKAVFCKAWLDRPGIQLQDDAYEGDRVDKLTRYRNQFFSLSVGQT